MVSLADGFGEGALPTVLKLPPLLLWLSSEARLADTGLESRLHNLASEPPRAEGMAVVRRLVLAGIVTGMG